MRFSTLAAAVAALSLSACAGLGPAAGGPAPEETPETPAAAYPAYETFDASGYEAEPPATPSTVVHDVPAAVMAGRVVVPGGSDAPAPPPSDPRPVQVEGYRVQVFTSSSRDAAERVREEALAWWGRQQGGGARPLEAVVTFQQPYYRVRLGAFGTRAEADAALAVVRRQYPEAFLVPDTVTVVR